MEKMVTDLSFFKGKKVFITGHTGFKGTWLCKILRYVGADVIGYSLNSLFVPNLYNLTNINNDIKSIVGDIRDLEFLQKNMKETKPEIVIHMAAQPLVRNSYENPVYTYETNVMGTVNILECIRLNGCVRSFVNVTTDKVYENKEFFWGYRENENLCGLDPYSNSKSCSELITHSYKESFFKGKGTAAISTARSGNVIGGGDFAKDRIIPDCVRAAIEKDTIIVRNKNSIRPYQHVLDCLSGYLLLSIKQYEDKNKFQGNYNFGPNEESCSTTGELVDLFCRLWGNINWISKSDNGPHEAKFLKLDCSKSKSVLNWHPMWNIRTAVEKVIEWTKVYLNNEDIDICMDNQIKNYFNL